MQDEDARQMIGVGIMLAQIQNGGNPAEYLRDTIQGDAADGMLDMVQEQLEAQLESWVEGDVDADGYDDGDVDHDGHGDPD